MVVVMIVMVVIVTILVVVVMVKGIGLLIKRINTNWMFILSNKSIRQSKG